MVSKKAASTGQIILTRLEEAVVEVEIEGITPVIPHKWSEKALKMMPGHPEKTQMREQKGPKNPEEEAESYLYRLTDGRTGIKATAFKAAMAGGARLFDGLTMTEAKVKFFVLGEGPEQLVAFTGTPTLHEDAVRNANGTADLRYRYYFEDWKAILRISYLKSLLSESSIISLVDAGGRGGVCDWRPSAPKSLTGIYGQFRVVGQALEDGA